MNIDAPARNREQLRSALASLSLEHHMEAVTRLMRPGMELITEGETSGLGRSRFGGEPDLPTDFQWPVYKGRALTFLAQLNLEDVWHAFVSAGWQVPTNSCDPEGLLPPDGILQFYCSWDGYQAPPSHDGARVLYHRKDAMLQRAALPSGILPPVHRLKDSGIRFEPTWDFPSSDDCCSADLPDAQAKWRDETWMTIWEAMERHRSSVEDTHRFFGYAQQIQGGQHEQCTEMLANDQRQPTTESTEKASPAKTGFGAFIQSIFDKVGPRASVFQASEEKLRECRLLFQMASDERIDSEWGDWGSHYFWMNEQDIRNRRFENACWIAECY